MKPSQAKNLPNLSATASTAATTAPAAAAGPVVEGESGGLEKVEGAKATGVREDREEWGDVSIWMRDALRQTPSWLVSMVVHMIILLVLALLTLPEAMTDELRQLVIAPGETEQFDELEELEYEPLEAIDVSADLVVAETEIQQADVAISPADEMEAAPMQVEMSEFGLEHVPRNDLLVTVGAYTGHDLSGRGSGKRAALLQRYGGTEKSEKAVAAALKWLAEHQLNDGGWSFDHRLAPTCGGQCRNPGSEVNARNAATAMAILPFLGAGQTHKSGKYRDTVRNGLYFLVSKMKRTRKRGSLWEPGGRMYSHGLASITLCEAYAMTQDKGLRDPAQAAIDYICFAQDPVGGGWRYDPRQPGDTSVVGWQIMALKSGLMAYLHVPRGTGMMASRFLDSVQANGGANYGYTGPGGGDATTAIGLLCRMYLDWKKDHPALKRGVQWLSKRGPLETDMYYNYYATQVMRHWEGDLWKKWNDVMRDQLVNSQANQGHETGSWYSKSRWTGSGGRLYYTSMATMILEVYYRHMPIYRKQSTEQDFPE